MNGYAELGAGGLLALLLLREVFAFLKARENNKNGSATPPIVCPLNATVELWELRLTKAVTEGLTQALIPTLARQTELLGVVIQNQGKMYELLIRRDERHG